MRKNKLFASVLATAVMVSMMGTTCFAAVSGPLDNPAATGMEVEGENDVVDTYYKIVVPTSIVFAADPFEQEVTGSNISSADFVISNKSNVAVKVNAGIKYAKSSGLASGELVVAESADEVEVGSDKGYGIYMAAQIATDATETAAEAAAFTTALKKTAEGVYFDATNTNYTGDAAAEMVDIASVATDYDGAEDDKTPVEVALGADSTECTFVLEKADYQKYYDASSDPSSTETEVAQFKAMAAENAGTAAFRLTGKLNTDVVWPESAIKTTISYSFIGLSATRYAEMKKDVSEDAQNYMVTPEAASFTANDDGSISYSLGKGSLAEANVSSATIQISGRAYDILAADTDNYGWSAATVTADKITFANDVWSSTGLTRTGTVVTITCGTGETATTHTVTLR